MHHSNIGKMKIITLTTDYGIKDYRAAALRGTVLSMSNGTVLPVDISHQIQAYSIVEAAYVTKNAFHTFPKGSVHIVALEGQMPIAGRILAFEVQGHFFVVPDNGLITLIFSKINRESVYEVGLLLNHNTRERFAKAAVHLAEGNPIDAIGPLAEQFEERLNIQPVVTQNRIRGTVIAIDNYQNAITNISKELFEKERKERSFIVQFRRNDPIHRISPHYGAVHQGEPLCLFNINGMLEIAVNLGRATELLGIKEEDLVEVVFGE